MDILDNSGNKCLANLCQPLANRKISPQSPTPPPSCQPHNPCLTPSISHHPFVARVVPLSLQAFISSLVLLSFHLHYLSQLRRCPMNATIVCTVTKVKNLEREREPRRERNQAANVLRSVAHEKHNWYVYESRIRIFQQPREANPTEYSIADEQGMLENH